MTRRTKRFADAGKHVVAVPLIARIKPVPIELALRAIPPQIQDVAIAIGVRKCTRYHPNHCPSNTLEDELHLGSRASVELLILQYLVPSIFVFER